MKKSSLISTLLSTLTIIALSTTITGCGSSSSTEPKVVVDGVEYNLLTLTQQEIEDILLNFSLEQLTELVNKVEAMYSEALDKYSDSISDLAKVALDNVKALLTQKQALVDAQNEADRKKAQEEADAKAAQLAANVKALATEAQKAETPPSVKEEVKKVVEVIEPEKNEAPIANGDSATTAYDTAVTIDVLANDTDPDGDAINIFYITGDSTWGGTVAVVNDRITYTPPVGYVGTDNFAYGITDPNNRVAFANVSVTVSANEEVDNTPPATPEVDAPATTTTDTTNITVKGEVGAKVFIDGVDTGVVIAANGEATVSIDTSITGDRNFKVGLKDAAGNMSTEVDETITRSPDNGGGGQV